MTLPNRDLLSRLQRATSRVPPDPRELDEETARMREGWLAWRQLLDAVEHEHPAMVMPPPAGRLRRRLRPYAIVACAAVLAALATWGWYSAISPDAARAPTGRISRAPAPAGAGLDAAGDARPGLEHPNTDLAWDDAFDDRLSRASIALWHVRGYRGHRDSRWHYLVGEFQQISDELSDDAL